MISPRRPKSLGSEDAFESSPASAPTPPQQPGKPASSAADFSLEDEDLPVVRQTATPDNLSTPPKVVAPVAAPLEDDFSPGAAETVLPPSDETLPSARRQPAGKLDAVGKLIAWILVPVLFFGVFYALFKNRPESDASRVVSAKPSLPIDGSLMKITELSSGWRDRKEGDRVSAEAQVITKATVYPTELPQVKLKISSNAASAFLRVLFINSEGKIAGDPRVVKIVDGKIQAMEKSDQILNDNECLLTASTGLQTEMHLVDYMAGDQPRWSVELSESNNYQARGDEWKLLQTFSISDLKS